MEVIRIMEKSLTIPLWLGVSALTHISLEAKPGQTIALVGATGSGKTTTISLLSRFYNIEGGHICVDGVAAVRRPPHYAEGRPHMRRRSGYPRDSQRILAPRPRHRSAGFPALFERGSHDELLTRNGAYAGLYESQFRVFREPDRRLH